MKIIIFIIIAILLIYGALMSYFYFDLFSRNRQLTLSLDDAQSFKRRLQEDINRKDAADEALQKENEQFKNDSLASLKREEEMNNKRRQIENILKQQGRQLKRKQISLEQAQKEMEKLRQDNLHLSGINEFFANAQVEKQKERISQLESDISVLEKRARKQEAHLHYNLGVGYVTDKKYDMAIDEYEKAISLNPEDPDGHYNLAILYDDYKRNSEKALDHYKKYLELKPDAIDADQVKEWVERLMLGNMDLKGVEAERPPEASVTPGEKIKGIFLKKLEEISKR